MSRLISSTVFFLFITLVGAVLGWVAPFLALFGRRAWRAAENLDTMPDGWTRLGYGAVLGALCAVMMLIHGYCKRRNRLRGR